MNDREICGRITDAYRKLAAEPGDFISIADLADAVGIHKDDLAAMLIWLYEDQQVNLVPRCNQQAIGHRDREAAIWCGGEYKHLISMGA